MGHPCKPNMSVPKNLQRDTLLEDNQHGGLAPWGMLMPCNTVVNLHGGHTIAGQSTRGADTMVRAHALKYSR